MNVFLYIISIFWISIGIFAVTTPLKLKTLYAGLVKHVKALFILPIIVGVLLLWAMPASSLSGLIMIIGILAIIKGLFILILPINLTRASINYFLIRSDRWWRIYGIFIILMGLAVGWSIT